MQPETVDLTGEVDKTGVFHHGWDIFQQLDMILQGLAGDGPVRDYTQSRWGRFLRRWCCWMVWMGLIHRFCQYWGLGVYCHSINSVLPSGKRLHNYGQSPFFRGKFTISMVIFHSYVTNYQRVSQLRAVTSSSQAHQGREGMEWMEWRQTLWILGL